MKVSGWMVTAPGGPMVWEDRNESPAPGEVLVEVAGCGICHTDLGFYYDRVPTRRPYPLTLGHEIVGTVVDVGEGTESWFGRRVIVPAVLPCGACDACRAGRGTICPRQIFPGNDVDGGFATHVRVPAPGLCPVPDEIALDLWQLAVVADAISTPYQAILRSGLGAGDLAVFVGAGGVGGFGVQVAAAMGAIVLAIDVDPERLALIAGHGARATLRADLLEFKEIRTAVQDLARQHQVPTWRHKIFETSGTASGQMTAYGLLGPGGYLGVVGFTSEKVHLRLSNLMALDAVAQGHWGCLPAHYPAIVDLVLSGAIRLGPFIERRPLSSIVETFSDLHARRTSRRVVLVPDS